MIGKIKGTLIELTTNEGLVETASGLAYWVVLPKTIGVLNLPREVNFYTYLQIRDDAHVLFAFENLSQYQMFILLLSVDGVGPKTAHLVISYKSQEEIVRAVRMHDVSAFSSISGLGKKTAQKIILELSSKMKTEFDIAQTLDKPIDSEALDALVALGYKKVDAHKMLEKIDPTLSLQDKIKIALKR
ncbi:MAG: Holliday junction branch migration protein RuvA [Patescibacteria group bacterium]